MSAAFVIPFNFQPTSVSVKTGSYTIPAGKYARVVVECDSGGTFTIDTVTAVTTAAFVNVDTVVVNNTSTYTVPTGFRASVTSIGPSNTTFIVNGNNSESITGNTYTKEFNIGPAGSMSLISVGAGNHGVQGVAIPSNATNRQAEFWLPTGTVINGTGTWRAVVMEFNQIT